MNILKDIAKGFAVGAVAVLAAKATSAVLQREGADGITNSQKLKALRDKLVARRVPRGAARILRKENRTPTETLDLATARATES